MYTLNFILLFALPYHHGAVYEARGGLEAGRGTRLRRADARRAAVPHRNVHLEALQVDAPHRPRADPRPLRRALRRHAQGPHRKGGPHAVQEHRPKHKRRLHRGRHTKVPRPRRRQGPGGTGKGRQGRRSRCRRSRGQRDPREHPPWRSQRRSEQGSHR